MFAFISIGFIIIMILAYLVASHVLSEESLAPVLISDQDDSVQMEIPTDGDLAGYHVQVLSRKERIYRTIGIMATIGASLIAGWFGGIVIRKFFKKG